MRMFFIIQIIFSLLLFYAKGKFIKSQLQSHQILQSLKSSYICILKIFQVYQSGVDFQVCPPMPIYLLLINPSFLMEMLLFMSVKRAGPC